MINILGRLGEKISALMKRAYEKFNCESADVEEIVAKGVGASRK